MKSRFAIKSVLLASLSFCLLSFSAFADDTKTQTLLTDQVSADNSGTPKDTFNKDTANFFFIVKSTEFKPGQKLKAIWIADDTSGAAPNNYKVGETELVLKNDNPKADPTKTGWNSKFALSKPTKGWPAGKYHVELFTDGVPFKTVNFIVK